MNGKGKGVVSTKWTLMLCILSFCAGLFFTNRFWSLPEAQDTITPTRIEDDKAKLAGGCHSNSLQINKNRDLKEMLGNASKMNYAIHTLDKTILSLEIELAAARAKRESILDEVPLSDDLKAAATGGKHKYLMVVGINTAFNSRKRRDSIRATWMPQGDKRKKLEEKGIIIRFVIGHSATSGGILNKAIEAEERKHEDFLRLDHNEGYLELSGKTKSYFATAVNLWDAEFYVKVDDDIHVNIATLGTTLARHRSKPGVYIGCMKSGPVIVQKGVRYHEPEYWKFGTYGNKYFRHATGQLYAISRDLATYISINQGGSGHNFQGGKLISKIGGLKVDPSMCSCMFYMLTKYYCGSHYHRHVLHKYANEDVSLGAWFIGLNVEHIDDRKLCCGTPPDCEWKAQAGNICVASFDWSCSGICRSVERMNEVHNRCGEGENVLWNSGF